MDGEGLDDDAPVTNCDKLLNTFVTPRIFRRRLVDWSMEDNRELFFCFFVLPSSALIPRRQNQP